MLILPRDSRLRKKDRVNFAGLARSLKHDCELFISKLRKWAITIKPRNAKDLVNLPCIFSTKAYIYNYPPLFSLPKRAQWVFRKIIWNAWTWNQKPNYTFFLPSTYTGYSLARPRKNAREKVVTHGFPVSWAILKIGAKGAIILGQPVHFGLKIWPTSKSRRIRHRFSIPERKPAFCPSKSRLFRF